LDGGGTKTDILLSPYPITEDNTVLRMTFGASNPNDVTMEKALSTLREGMETILKTASVSKEEIAAVFAGLAGCITSKNKETLTEFFASFFPGVPTKVESDAANSIALTAGHGDGCCLIAGTGSSAFVKKKGIITNIGGWGYLIDDGGSGCSIGQAVLKASYRDLDGRGAKTIMRSMAESHMGLDLRQGLRRVYTEGKTFIASFAPIAFKAYREGDGEAVRIIESARDELYLLIKRLSEHFPQETPRVSVCGGMFKEEDILLEPLRKRCEGMAQLIRSPHPPVHGACILAEALASGKI